MNMPIYTERPVYREEIRQRIRKLRRYLGIEQQEYIDIVRVLEHKIVNQYNIELIIVSKNEIPKNYSITQPSLKRMFISEEVYLMAIDGQGRDRLTIAHEISHLIFHRHDKVRFTNTPPQKNRYFEIEWQANAYAGELLAPGYLIKNYTVNEVATIFGISEEAAKIQKAFNG